MAGRSFLFVVLALTVAAAIASCGDTSSSGGGAGAPIAPKPPTKGVCADTCPKSCETDDDCPTSAGELCCSFGDQGKICTKATLCPRQCTDDAKCDTGSGEACLRVTLATTARVCTEAARGLQTCQADGDCPSAGDVCCTIYKEPVCLSGKLCPKACSAGSDCNNALGEVCCDTLSQVDTTLNQGGLCIHPDVVPCPTPCGQSSECDLKAGELCCHGSCAKSCEEECESSEDCRGQICCKSLAARSPLLAKNKSPGYAVVQPAPPCSGFACTNGDCLPGYYHCDGYADCPTGEDESGCFGGGCAGFQFACINGNCIDLTWRCDGYPDCPSGEDEFGCGFADAGGPCTGFLCSTGMCIDQTWKCDGFPDCPAGDDELGCPASLCPGTLGTTVCRACCDQNYATGKQVIIGALAACGCDTGPCVTSCTDYCVNPDIPIPSDGCGTCIMNSCPTVPTDCIADQNCRDYLSCRSGCP